MDTCKAASLYSSAPPPTGDFLEYVNAPLGMGNPPALPTGAALRPHIACPTTAGTGSEVTAICVFDLLDAKAKTGIANRAIRPSMAVVDPTVTESLPSSVTACSGFDVLSHAIESYTALPFSSRPRTEEPHLRPLSQGANPWGDIGCIAALKLCGRYMVRAVQDPSDVEARHQMMFAATLAGISFGNSGVHLPHGEDPTVELAYSKTLQVLPSPPRRPPCYGGLRYYHHYPLVFVASYLIYADVRVVPMHDVDRHELFSGWIGKGLLPAGVHQPNWPSCCRPFDWPGAAWDVCHHQCTFSLPLYSISFAGKAFGSSGSPRCRLSWCDPR